MRPRRTREVQCTPPGSSAVVGRSPASAFIGLLAALIALFSATVPAAAQFVTFTDPSEFFQFVGTEPHVITFDDIYNGTQVPPGTAIDGVIFNVDAHEHAGLITRQFLAVSSPNTLGVATGPHADCVNFFCPGESVTLQFPAPIRAIGAYFSSNPVSDGLQGFISITTAAGTAVSGDPLPEGTFGFDENSLRFVGLASAVPFSEATLAIAKTDAQGHPLHFGFVVDNIATSSSVLSTVSFARSVPEIGIPASGSSSVLLGDIEIDEMSPGVLLTEGQATIVLPPPLTFAGTPAVSALASGGLTLGPVSVNAGRDTLSFRVASPSSTSPAQLLISNIRVAVPAGAGSAVLCDTSSSPTSNPVCVTIRGTNGITPVDELQVASFTPLAGPVLTSSSVSAVGAGATVGVVLFGDALDQLTFTGPNKATLDFGPGITVVPGSIKVSADGKSLTVKIQVAPGAPVGFRDVSIVGPNGVIASLSGALVVNPAPTVTGAGTGPNGTGPLLSPAEGDVLRGQTVIVTGTGFQAATTVPSDLLALISGSGITVNSVSFDSSTQLSLDVDVAAGAQSARQVQVTNPDLGVGTSGAILAVQVAEPSESVPIGLAPRRTSGTATLPPTPTVNAINPSVAPTGATVVVTGAKFSATAANDFVTFTGPNQSQVLATIVTARAAALTVRVPDTAVDGPVTVAVSGAQGASTPNFTVSNPIVTAVTVGGAPASARRGDSVNVQLTGLKFQAGATVSFIDSADLTVGPATVTPATRITVPVSVGLGAQLGLRDVQVRNPDGGTFTLQEAFEVKLNSQFNLVLSLQTIQGAPIDTATFLPSVDSVQVTLDGTGKCTARTIAPTQYVLLASFPGVAPPILPTLTVNLVSTNHAGTATNDDCEPNLLLTPPVPAEADWSVGPVGHAPDVTSQVLTVTPDGSGIYRAQLASWDWGGTVHIDVEDATGTIGASLTLPGAGVPEGSVKTAADGLTDFEKFRGVYFVAPVKGSTGALGGHHRLNADLSKRNLFVRGLGFALDPTLPAGMCGFDTSTATPTPVPADPAVPCPRFQWGNAFAEIGVQVWDVTSSFNAAGTTEFPTRSLLDPTQPMLDLATVAYDTANCPGGALCDHTSKLGPRQWSFSTLGFSTFGTCCIFGKAKVFGRPLKAYFFDRPYLHQMDPPGTFLPTAGPLGPMLAPITVVCDDALKGSDNGTLQTGECSVNGVPGGDVFRPGAFDLDSTAMDTNNDGCVELPFVSDPSTLSPCDANADRVPQPSLQATFQQVARHLITHEMGHMTGSNIHTSDSTDLMYMYSINWTRDDHFSSQVGALIQIHNKGQQ